MTTTNDIALVREAADRLNLTEYRGDHECTAKLHALADRMEAAEKQEPVAWMTDDTRVCNAMTKARSMHGGTAASFNIPLYTKPFVHVANTEPTSAPDERAMASEIIADYKEHYDFPCQGESHMEDCITSAISKYLTQPNQQARIDELKSALEEMLEMTEEPPERNCSCCISPPCNDCVDHSGLREAFKYARAAIAKVKP